MADALVCGSACHHPISQSLRQTALPSGKRPLGVRGRSSDNRLIKAKLGWKPTAKLEDGLKVTCDWIRKVANA
jgi:nucleoside-diphosphate-sugar epimerase